MTLAEALQRRLDETTMHVHIMRAQRISDAIRPKFTQEEVMIMTEWRREEWAAADALRRKLTEAE